MKAMDPHRTIKSFPDLDMRIVWSGRIQDDPLLGRSGIRFYASGRSALFHIFKALSLGERDVVLMPSFHCGVEVEAALRAGGTVEFYRIGNDLSLDPLSVNRAIGPHTKAVVAIHYFGFPQNLSEVREICRERGIVLIEDCAHALYSRGPDGTWLGTEGDYGVFSMRKTTFIPNGGAVIVNSESVAVPHSGTRFFDPSLIKTSIRSALEHEARFDGPVSVISRMILDFYVRRQSANPVPAEASHESGEARWYYDVPMFGYEHDIAAISHYLLGKEGFAGIIAARRENYRQLERILADRFRGRFVFPELPDGTCPLCFPLFTDNRDGIVSGMIARGVEPFVFGRLLHPLLTTTEFPESCRLANSILGLPIHQQMTGQDLRYVAERITELLTGNEVAF